MPKSVARQPIFDRNLSIYACELLFRGNALGAAGLFDHDKATAIKARIIQRHDGKIWAEGVVGEEAILTRAFQTRRPSFC